MKRVEAYVSDEKVARLTEWARSHGVTRSEVIVVLIEGLLAGAISVGLTSVMVERSVLRVEAGRDNGKGVGSPVGVRTRKNGAKKR